MLHDSDCDIIIIIIYGVGVGGVGVGGVGGVGVGVGVGDASMNSGRCFSWLSSVFRRRDNIVGSGLTLCCSVSCGSRAGCCWLFGWS